MDEMTLLRGHYNAQLPPSPQAVSAARARMLEHARETSSGLAPAGAGGPEGRGARAARVTSLRTRRWPGPAGAALAAAAAAIAVAVTSTGAPAGRPHSPRPGPTAQAMPLSAGQILLAAATTAAHARRGSGIYWHVTWLQRNNPASLPQVTQTWSRPDGRSWQLGGKASSRLVSLSQPRQFDLSGVDLTFRQLPRLPGSPQALQAWLAAAIRPGDVVTSAGRPGAAEQKQWVYQSLLALIGPMPAPPKVRAAAFRDIASDPDVTSIGRVPGGQELQFHAFSGLAAVVINPATAQVVRTNFLVLNGGAILWIPAPATLTLVSGWSDRLPG